MKFNVIASKRDIEKVLFTGDRKECFNFKKTSESKAYEKSGYMVRVLPVDKQ